MTDGAAATAPDDALAHHARDARRRAALRRAPGRGLRSAAHVPLILEVLLALGLAGAFAGAVQVWRRSLATGRREDLRALAARRGWSLTVTGGRLGRAGTLRLASRGGHAFAVEVRSDADGGLVTEYEADSPRWSEGRLVAALAVGPEEPRAQRALAAEVARAAQSLPPLPSADGLLLFADADPRRRVILHDLARALGGWTGPGRPVLTLSPDGLRLRLRQPLDRADRMERFVDLAFDLSRVIGP